MISTIKQFFKKIFGSPSETEAPSSKPARHQTSSHKSKDTSRRRPSQKGGKQRQQAQEKQRAPKEKWTIESFPVAEEEGKTRFHDLNISNPLMHAIADLDFKYCTPIQAEILTSTLAGKDASGRAQTGTGKTAAFLITIFNHLLRNSFKGKRSNGAPRSLIIAPTRELVIQIAKDAEALGKHTRFKVITIFGGMDYRKQMKQLKESRVDVMVATPGRLLDFVGQKIINLKHVEILVIDEADRMLDMGFIPAVRRIIRNTPPKEKRQTLLFSATLTDEVIYLSSQWTRDAVQVEIEPEQVAVDTVDQVIYIVGHNEKIALLYNIVVEKKLDRVIVFANRRDDARMLSDVFRRRDIKCALLSGDVPQKKRLQTLERFRSGDFQVLVATDVAGRGIHVEGLDHVINFTLPHDPEDYVHRIGRTGRAGNTGTSISFASEDDAFQIPAIEEYIGTKLEYSYPEEEWLKLPPATKKLPKSDDAKDQNRSKSQNGRPRRRRRSNDSPRHKSGNYKNRGKSGSSGKQQKKDNSANQKNA